MKECIACHADAIECSTNAANGRAVAKMCMYGEGWLDEECAEGWACDPAHDGCYNPDPCNTPGESICTGEGNKTYKVCNEDHTWVSTVCATECDPEDGCGTCGDTFKQESEVCDDSVTDIQYKPTCAERFDKKREYKWTGVPACNSTCSGYVTGTCKHKDEVNIESWSITNLEQMKKDGIIDLKGGMTTSDAVDGGWRVGPWGNAKSPDWTGRYISFISSKNNINDYDTLIFNFKVKRNNSGPTKMKVAFYDGTEKKYESAEYIVTTSDSEYSFRKLDPVINGKLSVRISAYKSDSQSAGTMTISNMKLLGTKKAD